VTSTGGPGWWQASDGRWYPPATHPAYLAPPAQPTHPWDRSTQPGWNAPPQRTSPFAIASLILSIIWLGGLGSLLGIIFGAVSLSEIRKSANRLNGSAMATAGIVIGSVGLLVTILLAIAIPLAVHTLQTRTQPVTLSIGEAAVPDTGVFSDGIGSVTVESFSEPASANIAVGGQKVSPAPGLVFAVADVRVCAGGAGSTTGVAIVRGNLTLTRAGGPAIYPAGDAVSPALDRISTLPAGTCRSGSVTFEVPPGSRPAAVTWVAGPFEHTFNWSVGSH